MHQRPDFHVFFHFFIVNLKWPRKRSDFSFLGVTLTSYRCKDLEKKPNFVVPRLVKLKNQKMLAVKGINFANGDEFSSDKPLKRKLQEQLA